MNMIENKPECFQWRLTSNICFPLINKGFLHYSVLEYLGMGSRVGTRRNRVTLVFFFMCVLGQRYRGIVKVTESNALWDWLIKLHTDICTITNFHLKAKWSLHIAAGIVQIRTSLNINELLFVANCYANCQSVRIYHFI